MQTILATDSRNALLTDERSTVASLSNKHTAESPFLLRQSHSAATLQLPLQEPRPTPRFNVTTVDDEESIQDNENTHPDCCSILFSDRDDPECPPEPYTQFDAASCQIITYEPVAGGEPLRARTLSQAGSDYKAALLAGELKGGVRGEAKPEGRARGHSEARDNPSKGVAYYVLHTVLMSVNLYVNKASFELNPLVGVLQFTFIRGVLCTALMLLWGAGHLKRDLVDAVDRKALPSLVFRCTQGGLSVFISFMCIKFFNVSTVGIVCSLTPLFVCLIAYWLLGERLKTFDQIALLAVFASVCMVILGADGQESSAMTANPLALVALLSQPVLLAAGCVAMRQMRKMPETTCSTYQNLSLAVLSGACMLGLGLPFDFFLEFTWQAWLLVLASSLLTILTQTAKFAAFKYHQASALQKLAFVPNVWQFMGDLLILGCTFSAVQYTGFALLFGFYGLELARYFVAKRRVEKAAAAAVDDKFTRV